MKTGCMTIVDVLRVAAIALAGLLGSAGGHAQSYPDRPIKLLIGFAAGSSADVSARDRKSVV